MGINTIDFKPKKGLKASRKEIMRTNKIIEKGNGALKQVGAVALIPWQT